MGLMSKRADKALYARGGKVYNLIRNIAMFGIFVSAALAIIFGFGYIPRNSISVGFIGTVGIISAVLFFSLYWVGMIERKYFLKTAWVFVILLAVMAVLWLISLWSIIVLWNLAKNDNTKHVLGVLKFLKIILILSLQFIVASFIGQTVTRFKKSMLFFQGIAYISYMFFDFSVTLLLVSFTIKSGKFKVLPTIKWFLNPLFIMFIILAAVYIGIVNRILTGMEKKAAMEEMAQDAINSGIRKSNNANNEPSADQKLEKLKELLDKNLITQEEYDKKRSDIINNM